MADRLLVSLEEPFQVTRKSFAIGETSNGYTLQMSVDCKNASDTDATWSDFSDAIASNKAHIVENVPSGLWWRLHNNTDSEVFVRF